MNITHLLITFFILLKSAYIVKYFMEGVQVPGVLGVYFTHFFGGLIVCGQIKIRFTFLSG